MHLIYKAPAVFFMLGKADHIPNRRRAEQKEPNINDLYVYSKIPFTQFVIKDMIAMNIVKLT